MIRHASAIIKEPYLLVVNTPLYRVGETWWADPLWQKDLLLHLDEIDDFTVFCPVHDAPPPKNWVKCFHPRLKIIPVWPLTRASVLCIPLLLLKMDRAIRKGFIVHTGMAGWPYALGWFGVPLARLRGRNVLVNIESSFWRIAKGETASLRRRLFARIREAYSRACVNAADASFFTTEAYRTSLATKPRGPTHVLHPSWVDLDQILSVGEAAQRWSMKSRRLLFAGRLTEEKGIRVLIAAIEKSNAAIDIVGVGKLTAECKAVADRFADRVRLLDPVPHGVPFSTLLDGYQAVVIPTISDEQPRIIFDAFARGVPVIASGTSGHSEFISHMDNGLIVKLGDAAALAATMDWATFHGAELQRMGMKALEPMKLRTHQAMHRERAEAIVKSFGLETTA
ncbi:Glycosyltransferase involved in cell wall bisynthesis [Sphingomonas sp. YR710]|uniref:glycosyltransferase family 4 protein n=1 Tax=Sphingomonas sp. YR710 TaxID=1882773 RepID=UPI000884FAD3|nr:glycosyltransferase family 4 protein [Sphingomonas sp. YR710]SDD44228.1 Glycosyltransferase involved in cell wall bisynthesis [Sphingomonas sp. YR710]